MLKTIAFKSSTYASIF